MIQQLIDAVKAHARTFAETLRPTQITLNHPSGHPLAGQPAVHLIRKEANGTVEYVRQEHPVHVPRLVPVTSELCIEHFFSSLDSFKEYLDDRDGKNTAFALFLHDAESGQKLEALVEESPEIGRLQVPFAEHPVSEAWQGIAGAGEPRTLSHAAMADLLDDQRDTLVDDKFVPFLLRLRAAKTISYDGKFDDEKSQTVSVSFKVESEGGANVIIPRTFEADIPAFVGAWPEGAEPKHRARFKMRIIPPRRGDAEAMPGFLLTWVNYRQWEAQAVAALRKAVADALAPRLVFSAMPGVTKQSSVPEGVVTKFEDVTEKV